jgi:uncharacterized cupredoxin-like copper-binding protein
MATFRRMSGLAAVPVAALLMAGCSSNGGSSYGGGGGGTTPATSPPASTSQATAAGTPVTATEKEFSITLSTTTFKAGAYSFNVKNVGSFSHNLTIEGPGVAMKASPTMPGGGSGTLTVTLQKGSYELWCSVDGHKDRGMDLTIQVT